MAGADYFLLGGGGWVPTSGVRRGSKSLKGSTNIWFPVACTNDPERLESP